MVKMTDDREMVGEELAFARASDALLVKSLDQTQSFAEAVDDFRRLEAEFVARAGDEFDVLETKRRIVETILTIAHSKHPPFNVCREVWSELVGLGFTNIEQECAMARYFGDCCAYDEQNDEGLAVVEPLLADLQRRLEEAKATLHPRRFYEDQIELFEDLRDELEAQKRGEVIPWRKTRRADDAYQITPEEEQLDALDDELRKACRAVFKTYAKSQDRSFADVAHDYRKIEADIVARAGTGEAFEAFVTGVRRRIAHDIFRAACRLRQPFDVCREAWDEVVHVGVTSTWERWGLMEMYAGCCAFYEQPEAGLAVIEPMIEEIKRLLEKPKQKLQPPPRYNRVELERRLEVLGELRDKLKALRRGREASE